MKSVRRPRAAATAATALLLLPALPVAVLSDEPEAQARHFVDTSTDRTPAKTTFPKYPRIARRDRIEGEATVCFMIDKRGRIRRPRVSEATHPIFKRPAMRAIRASSFEPLGPDEVLATARTCRTYRFRLEPVLAGQDTNPDYS